MTVRGNGGNYTASMSIAATRAIAAISSTSMAPTEAQGALKPTVETCRYQSPREIVQEMRVITNKLSAEFGLAWWRAAAHHESGTNDSETGVLLRSERRTGCQELFCSIQDADRVSHAGDCSLARHQGQNSLPGEFRIQRQIQTAPQVLTIASTAQRQGDFSSTLDARGTRIPMLRSADHALGPTNRPANARSVPGNIIPSARFDPVAFKVLNEFVAVPNAAEHSPR